jgi:hypothetical protein
MNEEKVKALAANVNSLIGNYQDQQRTTAELFKVCLEFLDEKRTGHEGAGGFEAARAAAIKRLARKRELIAAVKGYIKMIETREKKE